MDELTDGDEPTRLPYQFESTAVTNHFRYKLVTDHDGSRLAIQSDDEGTVTLLEVDTGASGEIDPGGPMIGFADDDFVSLGRLVEPGGWPVIAFDLEKLDGRILADDVSSAHVLRGSSGDLVTFSRNDLNNPGAFKVYAAAVESGESRLIYDNSAAEPAPELRRHDRYPLGAELPRDWALLMSSFSAYIDGPTQAIKDRPTSEYPRLINLVTGEQIRLGLFVIGES